jgi:UDP-GlcNAc:undecaprenyl-phosphate GlcNAc-1-phosphate transferase
MLSYLLILILPWLLALVLTPWVLRWAQSHRWLDHPRAHKTHTQAMPVLGGVAVFGAMALGIGLAAPFSLPIRAGLFGPGSLTALAGGLFLVLAVGAYDDRRDLRASLKLVAQILIAAGTWLLGFRCGAVELPFGLAVGGEALPSFLVTVVWIVILINAFNLIDGLDGLAAGLGIIANLTIFVLAAAHGATVPVVAALALAGALSGFLRYNVPPARIFLGDAGSMGIGYTTAVLALSSYQKAPTAVVLVVPLIVLGLPVLDTIAAVVRRTLDHVSREGPNGLSPAQVSRAVFRPDRRHIHHLLVRMGWSVRGALFLLYAISGGLSLLALGTRGLNPELRWALWLLLIVLGVVGYRAAERYVRRREERLGLGNSAAGSTSTETRAAS